MGRFDEETSGLEKAAVILVQLGQEYAAPVLSSMEPSQIEELVAEVARLNTLDPEFTDQVIHEFIDYANQYRYAGAGGLGLARELLHEGLGSEKARDVMERLEASIAEQPFQFMRRMEGKQLISFLSDEHPQTIALVLAHLPAELASSVLTSLRSSLQGEVAQRIATMGRTSPEITRRIEVILHRRMSALVQSSDTSVVGGLEPLVGMIARADRTAERVVLESLEERDPNLAEAVRAQMFLFEDIVYLDNRAIQQVLREVTPNDLATALKGVQPEVRDKITGNLSTRAAENLLDELEVLGRVRISVVEEAQAKIVVISRRMEDKGEIIVQRGGAADEFVV